MFSHGSTGKLSVHFLDADGTVFNRQYHKSRGMNDMPDAKYSESSNVLRSNKYLIREIVHCINQADRGQVESTSLRQLPHLDQHASEVRNTETFCSALVTLHDEIQRQTRKRCHLETYSPPDVYMVDNTKITTFYVKIQRLAVKNPKKLIEITAWDDHEATLDALEDFFKKNKKWCLPSNVILRFVQHGRRDGYFYLGTLIKGEGQVNKFYEATIREFSRRELDTLEKYKFSYKHLEDVYKDTLKNLHEEARLLYDRFFHKNSESLSKLIQEGWIKREYYRDMLRVYYAKFEEKQASFFEQMYQITPEIIESLKTGVILDFYNGSGKITKAQLVELLLSKIVDASTPAEVGDVINTLCQEKYRPLVHDRQGMIKWSIKNSTWQGELVSATFDNLVKIAKCKILLVLEDAKINAVEKMGSSVLAFLSDHRRGNGKYQPPTHSLSLFKEKLAQGKSVYGDMITEIRQRGESVRKRYGISR